MTDHDPGRPAWDCNGCGDPWPCPPRRRQMLTEYDDLPELLRSHMLDRLDQACAELPMHFAGELRNRMLGWLPNRSRHYRTDDVEHGDQLDFSGASRQRDWRSAR